MNTRNQLKALMPSPWLDDTKSNGFRDQFRLIEDLKIDTWLSDMGSYFTPVEIYQWIYQKNGKNLFFKGLARLAPMFPVLSYHGQVTAWTSPPPSGHGNAIYLVMGHDKAGKLRLVGGNYFTEPKQQSGPTLLSAPFFTQYDQADQRGQLQLVNVTVEKSIQHADGNLLLNISRECEHFHTMAVYVTALTDTGSLFHAGKAVIEGVKPADFSYEFFGEI
jgi:hypothetical protein